MSDCPRSVTLHRRNSSQQWNCCSYATTSHDYLSHPYRRSSQWWDSSSIRRWHSSNLHRSTLSSNELLDWVFSRQNRSMSNLFNSIYNGSFTRHLGQFSRWTIPHCSYGSINRCRISVRTSVLRFHCSIAWLLLIHWHKRVNEIQAIEILLRRLSNSPI